MASSLWADTRQSFRSLQRNPTYSIAIVLTLALAIGATTTLFTVVREALLKPLPYDQPSRVFSIASSGPRGDREIVSHPWFAKWDSSARSFDAIAAYMPARASLSGRGEPVVLQGASATRDYFKTFGSTPLRGRFFAADDFALPEGTGPVVLSHQLWRERFGTDSAVVGSTVMLDGKPRTVIGITRDAFFDPFRSQYWEPAKIIAPQTSILGSSVRSTWVVARPRDNIPIAAALTELNALAQQFERSGASVFRDTTARVVAVDIHTRLFGSAQRPLLILSCGIALLFLVACANIANLGLARAASRQQEFATRTALGASRWRLARSALLECLLLSVAGSIVGLLVPFWTLPAVLRYKPQSLANVATLSVDASVLGFAMLAAVVTAVLFGVFPALASAGAGTASFMQSRGTRVAGGRTLRRVRHVLIVAEVATAVALVSGAGLLVRSLANVLAIDPGIRGLNTLTANMSLPSSRYASPVARRAFFDQLSDRVATLPGVEAVAYSASIAPLRGLGARRTMPDSAGREVGVTDATVSYNYPQTAGLILKKGRVFGPADRASAERPVLVSETAARLLLPGKDPIGQEVEAFFANGFLPNGFPYHPLGRVVGVVQDVAQGNFEGAPMGIVYRLMEHTTSGPSTLLVRSTADPAVLSSVIRSAVSTIDPLQPVGTISTLEKDLRMATGTRRFGVLVIGAFALLALALSATGLYGVMVFQLTQRTRELGIRMALGARASQLQIFTFREGMGLAGLGAVLGVALALAMTRLLRTFVFGVGVTDPLTLAGAPAVLLVIAAFSSYWPARRAGRVSPIEALRHE